MNALLHGGFRGQPQKAWEVYFHEVGKAFVGFKTLNIILVPWANSPKQWPNIEAKLKARANKYWPDITCHMNTAHTPKDLAALSNTADLVYCPGGIFINNIVEGMREARPELLQSNVKVFTGFSAGAYALASFYYDAKRKQAAEGGGLFKAAVCCHYTSDRKQAKNLLEEGAKQSPHLLTDGGFVWL